MQKEFWKAVEALCCLNNVCSLCEQSVETTHDREQTHTHGRLTLLELAVWAAELRIHGAKVVPRAADPVANRDDDHGELQAKIPVGSACCGIMIVWLGRTDCAPASKHRTFASLRLDISA